MGLRGGEFDYPLILSRSAHFRTTARLLEVSSFAAAAPAARHTVRLNRLADLEDYLFSRRVTCEGRAT